MTKFTFHMGIDVRAYGNVEIEAATADAAVALLTPDNVSEKFERGEITWDGPSNLTIIDAEADSGENLSEWSQHDIVDPHAAVYTQQQMEDALAQQLDKMMRRRGRLAVVVDGGIVQSVVTDGPVLVGLPVSIIDYDTEGAQLDALVDVVQEDGTTAAASVESYDVRVATITIPGSDQGKVAWDMQALLKRAGAMIAEDLTTHIFDEANGDEIPADDPHVLLIAAIDALVGDQKPPANEYLERFPEAVRPFADRAYADGYVDGASTEQPVKPLEWEQEQDDGARYAYTLYGSYRATPDGDVFLVSPAGDSLVQNAIGEGLGTLSAAMERAEANHVALVCGELGA